MKTDSEKERRGSRTRNLFFSAAEPSADSHCANLIKALKAKPYDYRFIGVGGPKMAEAGCELIARPADRAVMLHNAITNAGRFWKILKDIKRFYRTTDIDLTVVCDSPAFNFHVAKIARKHRSKTLFYVAPQLWAWAAWRIGKLRRRCDRLACILPFEPEWFEKRNLHAEFVGNPLMDNIPVSLTEAPRKYSEFDPENARIALMPGSRDAEIESLWPAMQQVALELSKSLPGCRFTAVAVDEQRLDTLKQNQLENFQCKYNISTVSQTAAENDFALVASGSATLQVAATGCPMIVMYQSSPLMWHTIGKHLVKMPHLSLVNILADKRLVPEFMPYFRSTEPIAAAAEQMLANPADLTRIANELKALTRPLFKNASENVASIIIDMLETRVLEDL